MTQLPCSFSCKIRCPNNIVRSIEFSRDDTGEIIKDKIDSSTGYWKTEIKLFFDKIEITDDETFEDLSKRGFTVDSKLEVTLVNPFEIIVDCANGRKLPIPVTIYTRCYPI
jgi:hypothetical protein